MNAHVEWFFRVLVEHRARALIAQAGLLAVAGIGASSVGVDYSAEQFFAFEGDDRATYDEYKRYFPKEDLQVSAFLKVTEPWSLDDYRTLERIAESFEDAGLTSVRWVGSTDFTEQVVEGGEPAVLVVRPEGEADLDDDLVRTLVASRRSHPLYSGLLWSDDLTVFAVHGYLDPADNNDARRREIATRLQDDFARLSGGSDNIVLNGLPILRVTVPSALQADMSRLLAIGILISFVVLWAYFQRISVALLCFAGVTPAIVLTLGAMGYVGRQVSVMTSAAPIVILVVAVSDATHLVVGTRHRWQEGRSVPDAVVATFTALSRSCFFTSLTTALGFAGLVATRNPLVGEFGVVTGLAVMIAFCVTMTLLPPLLSFAKGLGPRATAAEHGARSVVRLVSVVLGKSPTGTTAAFALVSGVALVLGAGLRVQALLIDDLKEQDVILQELRWMEREGFGVFQVDVFLAGGDGPHATPEMLAWIEDFQRFAEADPVVLGSLALPRFVDELDAAYGSGPEALAESVDPGRTTAEIQELLFLAELQDEGALDDVYQADPGVGQIILFVRDAGSSVLSPFVSAVEDRLDSVPPPTGTARVTGTVKLTQVLWDQLVSRFLPGVLFSIVLVWLALSWMFRSIRLGLLAVVPNLFPLVMLLALMRLGGFDLKPTTIIVFAIAFGIVADDTIHFLGTLANKMRDGVALEDAISSTLHEIGSALILVTVVVVTGFSVLMLGRFEVLFLIGLLTTSAALLALVADLVGFPAFLRVVGRRSSVQSLLTRRLP